ncbi:hypothetical protein DM860_011399 [Cuscuta australis]|uniref:Defensin-like protein n=1 Tax=Cuscuta australis TaxID=267555 RepID=A0A328DQE9_9ASTE|nr:hypothetical protein DM860_011399 [Cuscuta australis]
MKRSLKTADLLVLLIVALSYDAGVVYRVGGAICSSFTGTNQCKFGPDNGCFQLCTIALKRPIVDANCVIDGDGTTSCQCKFNC